MGAACHLAGYCPDKSSQLASHCGSNLTLRLAGVVGLIARFVPRITLSDKTWLYGFNAAFWRSCGSLPNRHPYAGHRAPE